MIVEAKDVNAVINSRQKRGIFSIPVDFGMNRVEVRRDNDELVFPHGVRIKVTRALKEKYCYLVKKDGFLPVAFFDDETGRFYKLMPTGDWPTVTIGSVPMHRVSSLSPRKDTEAKIRMLQPEGVVLDTCMGLGYTAIMAAFSSKMVYTFEKDRNIYFIARLNPLSRPLFGSSKIKIVRADITKYIDKFPGSYFDCIIHDPPTFKISPLLYSLDFYRRLHRVLKRKGKLFHYVPFYGIKRGNDFPARIKGYLKKAGFAVLKLDYNIGGILCRKN